MDKPTCSIDGCDYPVRSRSWCSTHYRRWWRHGDPLIKSLSTPPAVPTGTPYCSTADCDRPSLARGLCNKHYLRWYRKSGTEARSSRAVVDGKRACGKCGETKPVQDFPPDRPSCCKLCDAERKRQWHRAHPVLATGPQALPDIPCGHCGTRFQSGGIRRHCSRECAASAKTADDVKNVAVRRARQAQVENESFRKVEIFERDGWVCQLCDEPIERDLKWPNPGSVSLDHIVPISLGGAHTPANTQAAHLFCNLSKHNRVA